MKSKIQKKVELDENLDKISESKTIIFTDFSGVKTKEISILKNKLKEFDSSYKVVKKRLMRVAFEEKGIKFNPEELEAQLGVIFSPKELIDIASGVYKFSKSNDNFKILGGYDLEKNEPLGLEYINQISLLPLKEVLLGQLVGMISAPLKMFMLVLNERAKLQSSN